MKIRMRCIPAPVTLASVYGHGPPVCLEGAAFVLAAGAVLAWTYQLVLPGRLRVVESAAGGPLGARPGACAVRSQGARKHASAGRECLFPGLLVTVRSGCASVSHLGIRHANGQPGLTWQRGFTDDFVAGGGILGADSMDRQYGPGAGDVLDLDL